MRVLELWRYCKPKHGFPKRIKNVAESAFKSYEIVNDCKTGCIRHIELSDCLGQKTK